MTGLSGSVLRSELDRISIPSTGFSVRAVPGAPAFRIGRGAIGSSVVLLTPPDPHPDPPTRLELLSLDPRIDVSIEEPEGGASTLECGLVQLRLEDEDLLAPFLDVAAAIVRILGPQPAPGKVSSSMRGLVRIFGPSRTAFSSTLGLWGELLLMVHSDDPPSLLDAWHANVEDEFDFANEGSRLEVKTTTRDRRVHVFSLGQLKPVIGSHVRIVSMMTTETVSGSSVADLLIQLEGRLKGDPDRQILAHARVAEILGRGWQKESLRRFDAQEALASLVVVAPNDVPQVDCGPPEVLHVSITVDCSELVSEAISVGLAGLVPAPGGGSRSGLS